MRTKFPFLNVVVFLTFSFFTLSSCSKVEDITSQDLTSLDLKNGLIGSWQIVQKGVETEMLLYVHNGQTGQCNLTGTKTKVIGWEKATSDEKRDFKENGVYSLNSELVNCQGFYKVSNNGLLETNTDCENTTATIEELTLTFLILKEGNTYWKYQKVN